MKFSLKKGTVSGEAAVTLIIEINQEKAKTDDGNSL
jgi:hypothetical protein